MTQRDEREKLADDLAYRFEYADCSAFEVMQDGRLFLTWPNGKREEKRGKITNRIPFLIGRVAKPRQDEIDRLQDAKRRALAIADERAKENVALREQAFKTAEILETSGIELDVPYRSFLARQLRAALSYAPPASEGVRAAIIDECLNAARAGFEAAMKQYVLIGPSGMAMMMINSIKALPIAAPEPAITTEQLDKAQFGRVLHARPEPTDTPDEGPDPLGYAKGKR